MNQLRKNYFFPFPFLSNVSLSGEIESVKSNPETIRLGEARKLYLWDAPCVTGLSQFVSRPLWIPLPVSLFFSAFIKIPDASSFCAAVCVYTLSAAHFLFFYTRVHVEKERRREGSSTNFRTQTTNLLLSLFLRHALSSLFLNQKKEEETEGGAPFYSALQRQESVGRQARIKVV